MTESHGILIDQAIYRVSYVSLSKSRHSLHHRLKHTKYNVIVNMANYFFVDVYLSDRSLQFV